MPSINPKSLVTEVGIFAIGLGVILLTGIIWIVNGMPDSSPPFFGMARRTGIGLAGGIPAILNLLAGVFLLVKRNSLGIAACMLASVSIAIAWFAIMIGSGVGVRFNLLTLIAVGIPMILIARASKALSEIQ